MLDGVAGVAMLQAGRWYGALSRSVNARCARDSNHRARPVETESAHGLKLYFSPDDRRRRHRARRMAATELQLGPRIRALRQARSVTLRELAERAGVTESFLSQVEREVDEPVDRVGPADRPGARPVDRRAVRRRGAARRASSGAPSGGGSSTRASARSTSS